MEITVSKNSLGEFASAFWNYVNGATLFAFHGEMGAGKTTLINALCRFKGVQEGLSSPTFSIINEYSYTGNGRPQKIYHLDLYRLKSEEEVVQTGAEDAMYSGSVCMVEWPEKAPHLFDKGTVHVYIEVLDDSTRRVEIRLP